MTAVMYNIHMQKTLIFGGAFDPPHKEHVNMCKSAMEQLGIDRLVVVPTYAPPHKSAGYLNYEDRRNLASIAFEELNATIDDIEYERKRDNYSAYTLPILKDKYGEIVYLIGGDSLEYLNTWYMPKQVVSTCPIAVVGREGYDRRTSVVENLKKEIGGEYILLDYVGEDISSSVVRAKLLLGEKPQEIDDKVYEYIKNRGLFGKYREVVEKVKGYESDDLFAHSKAVVLTAVDLNSKHHLGLDFDKVFLASILHDNAKQRPQVDGLDVPKDSIGTSVLHQFLGAEKAKRDFGVEDEEILSAIRCHTTAKADMSTFEKLIYTADSVSIDRLYEPIPKLREIAQEDFERGFLSVLQYTYDKLVKRGGNIYPLTEEAKLRYLG